MNDFTKEELKWLLQGIGHILEPGIEDKEYWPELDVIYDKLTGMIDNYCEHEMEYAGHVEIGMCKHCEEIE